MKKLKMTIKMKLKMKWKPIPERRSCADPEIKKALVPVTRRLQKQHGLTVMLRGSVLAMAAVLLLRLYSYVRPWPEAGFYCLLVPLLILLAAAGWAFITRPGLWEAACLADAKGLKERATTALELSGQADSGFKTLQRNDALKHLEELDIKAGFPFSLPRREGGVLVCLVLFLTLINFIPDPQRAEVERQAAVRREIAAQAEQVEKIKKDLIKKNENLSSERREEGIKAMEELQEKLSRASQQDEAVKSLANTEDALRKLASGDETAPDDLQRIAQALSEKEISRELGGKMAGGDSQAIEAEVESLAQQLAAMSPEAKADLASALENAAAGVANSDMKQQLSQAAGAVSSGSTAAGQQLGALGSALGAMRAAAAVNSDLAQARLALQSARAGIIAAGTTGGNTSVASAGESSGTGDSPGGDGRGSAGAGEGASGQGGSGVGSAATGTGAGVGAGAGSGSGNRDNPIQSGSAGGETAGGNLPPGNSSAADYEKIYDPRRLGRAGEASYVRGQEGDGPEQAIAIDNPDIMSEAMLPYQQVIGEYSQAAQESLDRSVIPGVTRDLVREYFSALAED